jgi:hypothetical protein
MAGRETATMFESSIIKDDTSDDVSRIQNPDGAAAWFWSVIAVMSWFPDKFDSGERNRTVNDKRGALYSRCTNAFHSYWLCLEPEWLVGARICSGGQAFFGAGKA